ncbi:MAG: nitrilase-related carbon-nitrogen hydrolase [Clostridia bacterium]|nr:nitrilase-related carbon-nitrogen hydrolase [Clostridia bacterium]
MRIGLAAYEFINNDMAFNVAQMERALKSARGSVELLCFGEAFLQGFDSLSWSHEQDARVAIAVDSPVMQRICDMSARFETDLAFGYIEKCKSALYSSYALIENGAVAHNYRRISRGWKEYCAPDEYYKEGDAAAEFTYRGQRMAVALCGDLWDFPDRFRTDGILLWPIYVNYTLEEWRECEAEYAAQALLAAERALMVNSITKAPGPIAHGGAFCFAAGKTASKLPYDAKSILVVEV